jgi:hypothetical protein
LAPTGIVCVTRFVLGSIRVTAVIGSSKLRNQTPSSPAVARRLPALGERYPGLQVADRASLAGATDADRETNRWLGPLFVAIIFAFT